MMMKCRNCHRCRVDIQIRREQFFNRTKNWNGILLRRLFSPRFIRLNSRDKRNALSGRFQFAIDTKMIPAKRPGANNRYAQVAFACDFLCPFAFHRFEAAAVQLKQLGHVLFRLRC